jgi:hypothetical protein
MAKERESLADATGRPSFVKALKGSVFVAVSVSPVRASRRTLE